MSILTDRTFREKLSPITAIFMVAFHIGAVAALFVLLLAVTSIPVVLHPWPPMSDYINHLARMQVIATVNSDPDLARFYEIDWQLLPNLMMDLIVPSLLRVIAAAVPSAPPRYGRATPALRSAMSRQRAAPDAS